MKVRLNPRHLFPHRVLTILVFLLLSHGHAPAALSTFAGADYGAGPANARPNTDTAAAGFYIASASADDAMVIDFENLPTGSFTSAQVATGVTVNLSGGDPAGGISNIDDTLLGYNTTFEGEKHLPVVPLVGTGTTSVVFSFSEPVWGFGAYFTGLGITNGSLHVVFNDGTPHDFQLVGSQLGGIQFFGFLADDNLISSVSLQLQNTAAAGRDIYGIDDVTLVTIPEPATLSLLALGVFGMRLRRRA